MINQLRPNKITSKKVRLGSESDGGYVIPEVAIIKSEALFNYGVSDNYEYEADYHKIYNKPVFMFDHTIFPPDLVKGLSFKKEGLGVNVSNCKDFIDHYKERFFNNEKVLLKIDIEGGEFDYFNEANLENIAEVTTGLILEAHWVNPSKNGGRFVKLLEKLSKYYILCHVHGNNNAKAFIHKELGNKYLVP